LGAPSFAFAFSGGQGPGWELTASTFPSNLPPEGKGIIEVDPINIGAAESNGTVTVTDTLPPGLTAINAGDLEHLAAETIGHARWNCTGTTVVTCTNDPAGMPHLAGGGGNPTLNGVDGPNLDSAIGIAVKVSAGADASEMNRVTIAGGGAATSASTEDPITVNSAPPAHFGFVDWDAWLSNANGTIDTQAGSHPYEATFRLDFFSERAGSNLLPVGGEPRNVEVDLPPGFVGDPTAVPQCTRQQLNASLCPIASQIGIQTIKFGGTGGSFREQLFNMVPPPGVPAEFGANTSVGIVYYDSTVRSGGDYGITTRIRNIPQGRDLVSVVDTIWGVPGDPSHNAWRNSHSEGCSEEQIEKHLPLGCESLGNRPALKPFLTLPTSCVGAQPFTIHATTWRGASADAQVLSHDSNGGLTGLTGCEGLGFGPVITTAPDTSQADTPTGLTVEVKPPVGGLEDPSGIGTSDIQNTSVTLPEGLVINPGQAAGLQACQPSQSAVGTENEPSCPLASKIGVDEIETPLLPHSLKGSVYVLQSNPPNLEILVAASGEGVNLKLVGKVSLCERAGEVIDDKLCDAPGQLTTKFEGTPELPFTDFKLSFSGGAQAALDTPSQCGTYTTDADFNPWSSPFVADFLTTSSFGITGGPLGTECPSSPLPFAPTMTAGSTTDQAGGFTDFSLLLQRGDGQQRIEKLQFKEPAGLAGLISSVPLCPEPQASQGTCSAMSHIGHSVVTSGPGPYPLVIPQPGEPEAPIYLTGPYRGAPFGLSIVTPVIAGPFNLGTIVTRARIEVDPHTAQITVTTDPLPQIVKGVPTDLRSINAIIDRSGFLFNPTNCTPQDFTGTATSAGGVATAAIASHFGMGSCQSLKFKPRFSVSASGRNSKAGGASLDVKVAYPSEPQGSEANIARVKVDLPKQLPSRLTTLQKACTAAQFNTNPAGCPAASVVGHAIVHTSVLPVPLEGPAYFVSNGGEAFPNLIMVLQGYGVTVDLVGDTFINKAGITSSTFKSVPDVPFNTFELMLPQGPTSALATNVPAKAQYSLCGQKLTMPTELVAQNGAVINQATPIAITGCAKTRTLTRAQKLTLALKACHKKHNHAKRATCERTARKRYGPVKRKKK
jgi:hypothetical protein